ncbi:MAG: hypothetical protein IPP79_04980 [Chitinophagaceae bacterium]|nr:hypothetical protein [Chitinophagaceae bacterium]
MEKRLGEFAGTNAEKFGLVGEKFPMNAIRGEARYNSTTGSATLNSY